MKQGKRVDDYFVLKALQLYLEGVSYREIERLLGVSHVSVMNWVKQYGIKRPKNYDYHPTYRILKRDELLELLQDSSYTSGKGLLITEVGDKFMVIHWDRFRDR
jgi:transposase